MMIAITVLLCHCVYPVRWCVWMALLGNALPGDGRGGRGWSDGRDENASEVFFWVYNTGGTFVLLHNDQPLCCGSYM